MNWTVIIPTVLIVEYIAAAVVYAGYRDWKHVVYWIGAAILNYSVTFMKGGI